MENMSKTHTHTLKTISPNTNIFSFLRTMWWTGSINMQKESYLRCAVNMFLRRTIKGQSVCYSGELISSFAQFLSSAHTAASGAFIRWWCRNISSRAQVALFVYTRCRNPACFKSCGPAQRCTALSTYLVTGPSLPTNKPRNRRIRFIYWTQIRRGMEGTWWS